MILMQLSGKDGSFMTMMQQRRFRGGVRGGLKGTNGFSLPHERNQAHTRMVCRLLQQFVPLKQRSTPNIGNFFYDPDAFKRQGRFIYDHDATTPRALYRDQGWARFPFKRGFRYALHFIQGTPFALWNAFVCWFRRSPCTRLPPVEGMRLAGYASLPAVSSHIPGANAPA
jgi:hypothetical protein